MRMRLTKSALGLTTVTSTRSSALPARRTAAIAPANPPPMMRNRMGLVVEVFIDVLIPTRRCGPGSCDIDRSPMSRGHQRRADAGGVAPAADSGARRRELAERHRPAVFGHGRDRVLPGPACGAGEHVGRTRRERL